MKNLPVFWRSPIFDVSISGTGLALIPEVLDYSGFGLSLSYCASNLYNILFDSKTSNFV
ncbi:MAG: hypothetical protein MJK14_18855 [Rivularia sp. ALOHA_DT_140]|nr:hypothetical protein [Rivularia sp. ALOHA_DT_140]